jgi:Xaa-Pro aminopeptidase
VKRRMTPAKSKLKPPAPEPVATPSEFEERRSRLRTFFSEQKIDALLITSLPNVRYLSGFSGSNGAVLLTKDRALLFTDPRYQTQAPLQSDCEIQIAKGPLLLQVTKWLGRLEIGKLGFERTRISFESYDYLKREASKQKLIPVPALVEQLRMVKSAAELGTIKTSVELNSAALEKALELFRPEMTESDLAAEIDYRMRQLGADGPAFDTIVAAGSRTALPHAHPTAAPVKSNQLLLIDMGAVVAGYASDMTRTFATGNIAPKAKRIYRAVLESQLAAIDAVKPGVPASSVDRAARSVLKRHGFDQFFIHSTGHGLGLEIHEMPRIGKKERTRLQAGMAITIEPGVYVEELGGVRIEDTVVVTETGCTVLTPTEKDLLTL